MVSEDDVKHSLQVPKEWLKVGTQVHVSVDSGRTYAFVGQVRPHLGEVFLIDFDDELAGKPAHVKFCQYGEVDSARALRILIGKEGTKDERVES